MRAAGWPGVVSGAMFCTMFTCFMLAVTRTTVANALVVNSLYPVFAAILGWLVLGTPLRAYTWVAIAAGRRWHGMDVRRRAWAPVCPVRSSRSLFPVAAAVNVVTLRKWGTVGRSGAGGVARRALCRR